MNYVEKLKEIFDKNKDKRIVVLGTSCVGKTTIIKAINFGLDMDEEIFPLLTKEEADYVCSTPWTEEIGCAMNNFVKTRLIVEPGKPMFGTVLLDCDLIIYLNISDELLLKRSILRGANYEDVKSMKESIEKDIKESTIPSIIINVDEEIINYEENLANKYGIQ